MSFARILILIAFALVVGASAASYSTTYLFTNPDASEITLPAYDSCATLFNFLSSSQLMRCFDHGNDVLYADAYNSSLNVSFVYPDPNVGNMTCVGLPKPAIVTSEVLNDIYYGLKASDNNRLNMAMVAMCVEINAGLT